MTNWEKLVEQASRFRWGWALLEMENGALAQAGALFIPWAPPDLIASYELPFSGKRAKPSAEWARLRASLERKRTSGRLLFWVHEGSPKRTAPLDAALNAVARLVARELVSELERRGWTPRGHSGRPGGSP